MIHFNTFGEWRKYVYTSLKRIFIGLLRILWSVIGGIRSMCVNAYRSIVSFAARETGAMIVFGAVFLAFTLFWSGTFANERSARIEAEYARDSLSYELYCTRHHADTIQFGHFIK